MNKKYDIHERIFEFVISVIELLNKLPKTPTNLVLIGQLTRSATSMGANDQEADGASTTNDFLHCYTIVRKEGKESVFWLRVIGRTNLQYEKEAHELAEEGNEIVAIISTILKRTNSNRRK